MLLTVGMPLYNDAKLLPGAIESVLNQTFSDFEFIIVDNCSTDGSYEIAKKYAEKDSRIKLYRNHKNVGAFNNFRIIERIPKADFFCFKSSDDKIAPTYFEELLKLLKSDNEAVLAYSNADNVDDNLYSYDSENPLERAKKMARTFRFGHVNYGIYRTFVWDEISPPMRLQGNDHYLLMDVCFYGKILYLDKVLYYRNVPEVRIRENYASLCGINENDPYSMIRWLAVLIGHMRVIQKSDVIKNKNLFCREIAEITFNRYGKEIIKEFQILKKSFKVLRRIKDENRQWKLFEMEILLREVKTDLEYVPHFHEYLFKETSSLWKILRILKRKLLS